MSMSGDAATAFGRVDAEGTVFVRTAAGERQVGSWQAGSPEEGLAHFCRRYADLATEVELLERRLASGAAEAQPTLTSTQRLRGSLDTAAVVGDLDSLAVRLDTLAELATKRVDEERAARMEARDKAASRKRELVDEAERIGAESSQWKSAGDRLREILDEWKTIKGVDRRTDADLWKRFSVARDAFTRRRGTHFAGLDAERKQAQVRKEELVARAEELAESSEWTATANQLKQLMTDWKAVGRAPKEAEERLWTAFRAAQDRFFARRGEVFAERDAEQRGNIAEREALLAEAQAIDPGKDPAAAQSTLRIIQERWDAAGRVPRDVAGGLDRRLREVEDRVRDAAESRRRPTADVNPLLEQMRTQVAEAEQRLQRARTAGDARRVAEAERALAGKRQFLDLAERSR